jgi:hypothetical protein
MLNTTLAIFLPHFLALPGRIGQLRTEDPIELLTVFIIPRWCVGKEQCRPHPTHFLGS